MLFIALDIEIHIINFQRNLTLNWDSAKTIALY